jgi:hypothetical protein
MTHSEMFARLAQFDPAEIIQKTEWVNTSGSKYTVNNAEWTVANAVQEYEYRGGFWVAESATAVEHFLNTGKALEVTKTY